MLEFDAYAAKVFSTNFAPYMMTSDIDAKSGEWFEVRFADPEIVRRFAILCGDAIHNLRTALDFAWYELTGEDCTIGINKIAFPIYPTRKHLEDFLESRKEQQSVVRLREKLLNRIQPYKGGHVGGDLIYALHRLDLRDKHRIFIPQVQVSHVRDVGADDRTVEGKRVIYGPDLINTYGAKDEYQGQLSASIIFGKGALPVEGKPVSQTLRAFRTAVEATLLTLHF